MSDLLAAQWLRRARPDACPVTRFCQRRPPFRGLLWHANELGPLPRSLLHDEKRQAGVNLAAVPA
jgi:hypothetical protein